MLSKDIKLRQSQAALSSPDSGSLRSPASSIFKPESTTRYSTTIRDPGLLIRDWLVVVAELFISLAWLCIRHRVEQDQLQHCVTNRSLPIRAEGLNGKKIINTTVNRKSIFITALSWRRLPEELKKRGLREREEAIDFLFWEGWVVFGSLIVGYFIDSHISYYKVALFNVIFHFGMTSFIFMEEIIMIYDKQNPYSDVMSIMAIVSIVVIKSTDYTRYDKLVLGLKNLKTKSEAKISLFLFAFLWVGGRISEGGLLWTILRGFDLNALTVTSVALTVNGLSIYFYVFLLKPVSTRSRPISGYKIAACMASAILRKMHYRKAKSKSGFFSFGNRRYDKRTVLATKEMIRLFKNLISTVGYGIYLATISEDLIQHVLMRLKATGMFYYMGLYQGMRVVSLVSMLISQFAIIPSLTRFGVTDKLPIRFFIGYLAAILSMFYAGIVMTSWSTNSKFSSSVGEVRIFNVRNNDANFSSREPNFTKLNFSVRTGEATSLRFPSKETRLFKMAITFEEELAWTTHLSVDPSISTGYILTENPPYVMRIGEIPVEEGPPGTNDYDHSRLYLFNSVARSTFRFTIKKASTNEEMYQVISHVGVLHVFQLPGGQYDVGLLNMARLMVNISIGGVYGILLYSDGLRRKIILDETVPANSLPSSLCIGFVVPAGFSLTFAYVSLRAITFTSAPEGLIGIAFGFLTSVEYLSTWILYIGYKTWHPYAKAETLFSYGCVEAFFLFVTMFVFMKYKDGYGW